MTRSAPIMRKIALIVAGGSFSFLAMPAVQAEPSPPSESGNYVPSFNISPLRFEFNKDQANQTLTITNTSARPMPIQTRLFAWTQSAGEDKYALSSDFAISPSIISIAPGQSQIVRIMRRGPASEGEKRFRLAVDQLPDPDALQVSGASALIRFTVPVFADRDTAAPARLSWQIASDRIELVNDGGQTSRVVSLQAKTLDGREIEVERNTLRYIQGNSTIAWPIKGGCELGRVKITAMLDGQAVDVEPYSLCS